MIESILSFCMWGSIVAYGILVKLSVYSLKNTIWGYEMNTRAIHVIDA